MSQSKRIYSLILAMLLTGSTVISCGDGDDHTSNSTDSADTAASNAAEDTAASVDDGKLPSGLPEMDLEGYTATFFGKNIIGITAEDLDGEIVNDAVYNRNAALSEKYNFNIAYVISANAEKPIVDVMQTVLAGDDDYQVLLDGGNRFTGFIQSNLMYDMNELKYQDYTKPWWIENLNHGISLRGKLYMSVSSFMLPAFTAAYHPFVNADLAADLDVDVDALYQAARDGKWTIDRLIELTKIGSADLNGDGVMDHTDRWSFQSPAYGEYTLAVGAGFQIAKKDENDEPYFSIVSGESIDLWDKLCGQIYSDRANFLGTQHITGTDIWAAQYNIYKEGRALVFINVLDNAMRDYTYHYAILPSPKYDEEQEYYYHTASCWGTPMLGVPITVQDPDKVSFVLEAMAYASYYDVMPAFYQDYVERKLVRDEESVEMLKIIHNSMFFDAGSLYNWGALVELAGQLAIDGKNDLVTKFAAVEKKAEAEMKAMMDSIGD